MKRTAVQKLSDGLVVLLVLLLCLDILVTPLTPVFACFRAGDPSAAEFSRLLATFGYDFDDGLGNLLRIALADAWRQPYTAMLALFLLVCGVCGAVILVQGIRLLASVADGSPFSDRNAVSLRRAAVCAFLISAAALVRTVSTAFLKSAADALLSYTALFIPLFMMAGLLCLLMSGLFRQATVMKAENDLTI